MKSTARKTILPLLALVASALTAQNPLVASAASSGIQESDLIRPSIVTLARTDEDIEEYRIRGEQYGSVFALEHGDSIGYRQTFDYLPNDSIQEYNYWEGLTNHTLKWKAVAVTRVQGVYATSSLPFMRKSALESGSVWAEERISYEVSSEINILFTAKYQTYLRDMANFYVDGSYSHGEFSVQEGLDIVTNASQTFRALEEHTMNVSLSLKEGAADYCPDGWAISIGLIGTYYIVDFEYQDFTNWWWGQQPTNGSSPTRMKVTIADESAMSFGLIHRKDRNDGVSYGFYDYRYL